MKSWHRNGVFTTTSLRHSYFFFIWWLLLSLPTTTPLLATTTLPDLPNESFFKCLLLHSNASLFKSQRVQITDIRGLKNVDASYLAELPTKIIGLPTGLWNPTLVTDTNTKTKTGTRGARLLSLLSLRYGKEITKWHFAGEGSSELPLISRQKDPSMYLPFKEAVRRMLIQEQRGLNPSVTAMAEQTFSPPSFFHQNKLIHSVLPSNVNETDAASYTFVGGDNYREDTFCGPRLDAQLARMKLTNQTPLYAMASTSPLMAMESFNNITGRNEFVEGWPAVIHSSLADKMSSDGIFSKSAIESVLPIFNETSDHDIEIYFATPMSGTYFHSHGAVVTSTTSVKLWMLFSPEKQCRLLSPNSQALFNAGLPPKCVLSSDKQYAEQLCFGQLHPLEIFRKYEEMQQVGVAPLLMLQQPGEILVLPESWMHATVNLESGVSVAYRFPEKTQDNEHYCPSVLGSFSNENLAALRNQQVDDQHSVPVRVEYKDVHVDKNRKLSFTIHFLNRNTNNHCDTPSVHLSFPPAERESEQIPTKKLGVKFHQVCSNLTKMNVILSDRDISVFDASTMKWTIVEGVFTVYIGSSTLVRSHTEHTFLVGG